MTEPSPAERQERIAAYEYFSRIGADWDYESWEAEHLRDKAGKFSWMGSEDRSHRKASAEDGDSIAELPAKALARLGNRLRRSPRRVACSRLLRLRPRGLRSLGT